MDIQKLPSALQSLLPNLKAPGGTLPPDVKLGEMLTAVVEAKLSDNRLLLKLTDNGQLLRANSSFDVKPGEVLKLEVVKLGVMPELKIVPPEVRLPPEAQAVQQAFRQFLPQQQSLANFTGALFQAAGLEGSANTPLQDAARTLLKSLPQKTELMTAKGLKSAVENSGLFREAKLAAGAVPENDLKGQLLSLAQTLKNLQSQAPLQTPSQTQTPSQPAATAQNHQALAFMDEKPVQPLESKVQNPSQAKPETESQQPASVSKEDARLLKQEVSVPGKSSAPQEASVPGKPSAYQEASVPEKLTVNQPVSAPEKHVEAPLRQPVQSSADQSKPADNTVQSKPDSQNKPFDKAEAVLQNRPDALSPEKAPPQADVKLDKPDAKPFKMPEAAVQSDLPVKLDSSILIEADETPRPADLNQPSQTPEAAARQSPDENFQNKPSEKTQEPAVHHETLKHADQAQAASVLANSESLSDIKSLLHKTEGALARIVLDQLASIPKPDEKQIVWQIEIPYTDGKHADAAKLKIVREGGGGAQDGPKSAQAYWSVVLELNPPGIGTVHSRIMLSNDKIDSCFWSDQKATRALIEQNLGLLNARLEQAGLNVGQLSSMEGAVPEENKFEQKPAVSQLLNERA